MTKTNTTQPAVMIGRAKEYGSTAAGMGRRLAEECGYQGEAILRACAAACQEANLRGAENTIRRQLMYLEKSKGE